MPERKGEIRAMKEKNKSLLWGALIGSVVGSVTALLLAPKSGKELRQDIAEGARTIGTKTQEFAGKVSEQGVTLIERVKDTAKQRHFGYPRMAQDGRRRRRGRAGSNLIDPGTRRKDRRLKQRFERRRRRAVIGRRCGRVRSPWSGDNRACFCCVFARAAASAVFGIISVNAGGTFGITRSYVRK